MKKREKIDIRNRKKRKIENKKERKTRERRKKRDRFSFRMFAFCLGNLSLSTQVKFIFELCGFGFINNIV